MTWLKYFLREHTAALVAAFFVGLIMIGPQLYFIAKNIDTYNGIYLLEGDAEQHYLSRERAALVNRGVVNPFIKGAQNEPNVPYSEIEAWVAYPSRLFGISITNLNLIYKFVCPSVIFLLFYFLLIRLEVRRLLAITGSSLIVMGSELLAVVGVKNLLFWREVYDQFAVYARPINPQVSSIFFCVYLLILLSYFADKKRWKIAMLSLILGASFYVYFYTWSFILVINGIWFLASVLKRKFDFAPLLVIFGGLIMGIPALRIIYLGITHVGYRDLSAIAMIQSTHKPILGLVAVIATGLFFYIQKKSLLNEANQYFLLIAISSTWVVNNQQIITGLNIQAGHYHWYYNTPIYVVIFIIVLNNILYSDRYKKVAIPVIGLILLAATMSTVLVQTSSFRFWNRTYQDYQDLGFVIKKLKQTQKPESVILANDKASELVNLFGGFYIFWSYHSKFYLYSDNRRQYTQEWLVENWNKHGVETPSFDVVVKNRVTDDWLIIDAHWPLIVESGDWQAYRVIR